MNRYKVEKYEDSMIIKAALCSKYPDAADAINDIYKSSDDGWVDAITEDEVKGILIFHGLQAGAPVDWTIDFYGEEVVMIIEDNEMEEEIMRNVNEEMAVTMEEVTAAEKAKEFIEVSKGKLQDGFKFAVEKCENIAEDIKDMADMSMDDFEDFVAEKGEGFIDRVTKSLKDFANKKRKEGKANPFFADVAEESADRAEDIISLIRATLDKEGLNGWGKFKAIVKEIAQWLVKLLVKVATVVLHLAFTIAVGALKLGIDTLVIAGRVAGTVNKEMVKPSIKAGKTAWANHKKRKAKRKEEQNIVEKELFDDFDDEE